MFENIKFLPLNLQHFAADAAGEGANNTDDSQNNAQQESSNPTTQDDKGTNDQNIMIPKTRFDEVNTKYKDAKEQLDKILQKQKDEELERQKQQGKFEDLYNTATSDLEKYKKDFESANTRVEELEGVINSMLNTKLETIPEEYHDLIPDNLNPEQKLDWISKAETKGLFKDTTQEPVGGQTNPTQQPQDLSELSATQLLSMAYGSKNK